jgi:hypothetical protein
MAIGSGSEGAQTALQEHYKPDMSLADAEVLALSTLKQVMEEKVSAGCCPWFVCDSTSTLVGELAETPDPCTAQHTEAGHGGEGEGRVRP